MKRGRDYAGNRQQYRLVLVGTADDPVSYTHLEQLFQNIQRNEKDFSIASFLHKCSTNFRMARAILVVVSLNDTTNFSFGQEAVLVLKYMMIIIIVYIAHILRKNIDIMCDKRGAFSRFTKKGVKKSCILALGFFEEKLKLIP